MKRLAIYSFVAASTFALGIGLNAVLSADPALTYSCGLPQAQSQPLKSLEPELLLPPVPALDNVVGEFDPTGDYHPLERMADEFEKSAYFDLAVKKRKGKLWTSGKVMSSGTAYKFGWLSMSERTLEFTTVNLQGVEFKFAGHFLGSGNFASQTTDFGRVMLEGTLQKFKNGELVGETTSLFRYFPGC